MRVFQFRISKLLIICLIFFASLFMLANKVQYQIDEDENDVVNKHNHRRPFRQTLQNIEDNFRSSNNNDVIHTNVLVRSQRSVDDIMDIESHSILTRHSNIPSTSLDDIFISVKTTVENHKPRILLLLETWINSARNQTYIFTDTDDPELNEKMAAGHVINTNCPRDHYRKSLVCKMAQEFDWFINKKKRWFCHMDDDTYLNVAGLVNLLKQYNHTDDWYLGRPSLGHPIEVMDRLHPGQNLAFWFATGGAGFCISRALALKMVPYAGGGRMKRAGDRIRLPDDCTIGFIIDILLHKELTVIKLFHSHLEALWIFGIPEIANQITFSYGLRGHRENVVNIAGFSHEKDPTRYIDNEVAKPRFILKARISCSPSNICGGFGRFTATCILEVKRVYPWAADIDLLPHIGPISKHLEEL